MLDETRTRDWSAFDGLPLVEVVDRLYAEWVEREIVRTGNLDDPGMAAVIRHRSGNQWWSTYYDSRTLGQAYNLPKIVEGNCFYFRDRLRMLNDCITPLLAALCSGKVQIEVNQDHENNYRVVRVPSRLWKDGNWILYRNSVPELITVRFVTGSRGTVATGNREIFHSSAQRVRLSVDTSGTSTGGRFDSVKGQVADGARRCSQSGTGGTSAIGIRGAAGGRSRGIKDQPAYGARRCGQSSIGGTRAKGKAIRPAQQA
jgi:hypothetical protein